MLLPLSVFGCVCCCCWKCIFGNRFFRLDAPFLEGDSPLEDVFEISNESIEVSSGWLSSVSVILLLSPTTASDSVSVSFSVVSISLFSDSEVQ